MIKFFTTILSLFVLSTTAFAQKYSATISTSVGDIELRLFDDTPLHRDNFVTLAREGYYDSLLFHRAIANFMIQTGDPASKSSPRGELLGADDKPYTVPAEFRDDRLHYKGAVAAARLGDDLNPQRASSGGQFYITVAPAHFLNGTFTVFGEIIGGQEIADKISRSSTDTNDRPKKDIRITKITINETTN